VKAQPIRRGDLVVAPVPFKMAKSFIGEHHYMKGCTNAPTAQFGLFKLPHPLPPRWTNGSALGQAWVEYEHVERLCPTALVGTIMFATPGSENVCASVFGGEHNRRVTELHRVCLLDEIGHNAESSFVTNALAMLKEWKGKDLWGVLSYADTSAGHVGTIYQASNAYWTGTSPGRASYRDETGRTRSRRQCNRNISVGEAKELGWDIIPGKPKQRYLFLMPNDKRHKRELAGHERQRSDGSIEKVEAGLLQLQPLHPYPKLGYTSGRLCPAIGTKG
jgi:hypothetical protein